MTTPPDNPVSGDVLERALTKKHAEGTLQVHSLVPAVFAAWPEEVTMHPVPVDHVHLPSGATLDIAAMFDPETSRMDALMMCPTTANGVLDLSLSGVIILVCLN